MNELATPTNQWIEDLSAYDNYDHNPPPSSTRFLATHAHTSASSLQSCAAPPRATTSDPSVAAAVRMQRDRESGQTMSRSCIVVCGQQDSWRAETQSSIARIHTHTHTHTQAKDGPGEMRGRGAVSPSTRYQNRPGAEKPQSWNAVRPIGELPTITTRVAHSSTHMALVSNLRAADTHQVQPQDGRRRGRDVEAPEQPEVLRGLNSSTPHVPPPLDAPSTIHTCPRGAASADTDRGQRR